MQPLTYVETNWLIALLFPHDEHHVHAMELLARVGRTECELRIPHIAFVEAKNTMVDVSSEFHRDVAKLKDKLSRGYLGGWDVLHQGYSGLSTPAIDDYLRRDLRPLLGSLASNPDIHRFSHPTEEVELMGTLWSELGFKKSDAKDFYIFASIIVDRQMYDPARPAIFMSSNDKEFDPGKNKVPQSFYEQHRLLWRRSFDALSTAIGAWKASFESH